MLPFSDELSSEEKKKWIAEWRRLLWHSPRFVAVFAAVAAACILFFALFMPAWEFTTETWSRWLFGLAELGIAYRLADFAAYGFSKTEIEGRIAASLGKKKNAEPAQEPTAPSGRGSS